MAKATRAEGEPVIGRVSHQTEGRLEEAKEIKRTSKENDYGM